LNRCPTCGAVYAGDTCTACGFVPAKLDGFESFAPEFGQAADGFKASYFPELARLEETNFWFRGRNRLIVWATKTYAPQLNSFLEIGCGMGYVLSGIADAFPRAELSGSEIFTAGLAFSSTRVP
jgi:tRNA G46 methylase TrmB